MRTKVEDLFSLKGKTILITGASRGIGHALAEGCAAANGRVFALARSLTPREPFSWELSYRSCDITKNQDVKRVCRDIAATKGQIDVLVNCVGISLAYDPENPMAGFLRTIEVNLSAVYQLMQEVYPYMKVKGGSIINITSLASQFGMPENPGYVASKGGLTMLSKGLAVDWGKDGIRVNTIRPGYIRTDMTRKSFDDETLRNDRLKRMILPRWGEPGDLLGAVLLLASDASSYITGSEIVVDGGWSAKGL